MGADRAGSGCRIHSGDVSREFAGQCSPEASIASTEAAAWTAGRGSGSQGVFCCRHCQPVQGWGRAGPGAG
ncbi:MAG TPA: hypothetical protein DC058_15985 [Planctomycetaceae bacterium]|nr:hypothetical protein [Planctomycetaceae bacterium]